MLAICTSGADIHSLRGVDSLLATTWLHHWWELKLLVVEIIGLLTSVSLAVMTREFLIEVYTRGVSIDRP